MYYRVKLYAQDGTKRTVNAYFESENSWYNFTRLADHNIGLELIAREGIQKFSFPLIPGNQIGIKMVMKTLYPNLAI